MACGSPATPHPHGAIRGGTADAVWVDEVLDETEPPAVAGEYGGVGDPHGGERDMRVVGGHVEGPEGLPGLEACGVDRHEEPGDALAAARRPAGAGEDEVVGGGVHAGVPGLLAVDHPVGTVAGGAGLHERRVAAVRGFGDAEREVPPAGRELLDPL